MSESMKIPPRVLLDLTKLKGYEELGKKKKFFEGKYYLSLEKLPDGSQLQASIIKLNWVQRVWRTLFGAYASTHSAHIAETLREKHISVTGWTAGLASLQARVGTIFATAQAIHAQTTQQPSVHRLPKRLIVQTPEDFPSVPLAQPPRSIPSNKGRLDLLLSFYRGMGKDDHGRTLQQIVDFDVRQKESVHNYIQWLFPLRTATGNNLTAPLWTDEWIDIMKQDPIVRANLQISFESMLSFYGLTYTEDRSKIVRRDTFNTDAPWLQFHDHNHLRISRILTSLCTLGFESDARKFLDILQEVATHVDPNDKGYWQRAIY